MPSPLDKLDPAAIPVEDRFPGHPKELVAVLGSERARHWGGLFSLVYSADGRLIASSGGDRTVRIWDAKTLRLEATCQAEKGLLCVALGPDGKSVASGDWDGTVYLWTVDKGKATLRATLKEHKREVRAVSFGQDGKILASAGFDGT